MHPFNFNFGKGEESPTAESFPAAPAADQPADWFWVTRKELRNHLPKPFRSNRRFNKLVQDGTLIAYDIPGSQSPMFDLTESKTRINRYIRQYKREAAQRVI